MTERFLHDKLAQRIQAGNLRKLPGSSDGLLDFVSNDYLGLAGDERLCRQISERIQKEGHLKLGGTGSRLLSGNHAYYHELEEMLRSLFRSEAALVFNSGYAANQGVVSAVAEKGDTIVYDQLSHVCLKEGAWLSKAETVVFRHNDLEDLEMKIRQAKGRVFVVTETLFSMDGDIAPIAEILDVCETHGAYVIVDEAHSTGTMGEGGAGYLVANGLHERVFARVYTFGKAMGSHGACVAGSRTLIDYLINFARPLIYTTALPPHSIFSLIETFSFLHHHADLQQQLESKIERFRRSFPQSVSETAIQPVCIGSNEKAREASLLLRERGFDVRPVLSPTVRRGTERLRISLHVHNTDEAISKLATLVQSIAHQLVKND